MNNATFAWGFRVAGALHAPRRLVTWRKAWAAHCGLEIDTNEAYLSAWLFGLELLKHVKVTSGIAGFAGPTWAEWVPIDIDGIGPDPVGDALDRTRRLLTFLERETSAGLHQLSCWFSGGKGFHILLPVVGLYAEPGSAFHSTARRFVEHIGRASDARPDLAIYDAARLLRAPNTRHPKSGLFKVPIPGDELMEISAEGVRRLAAEPRTGDIPEPTVWCDWHAASWWREAKQTAESIPARRPGSSPRTQLNRATLGFMRNGADAGERHSRLFQAAANLGEFDCPDRLALALLFEPARDSGLSPSEINRAIADGLQYGKRGPV